jgi:hypothetical protein
MYMYVCMYVCMYIYIYIYICNGSSCPLTKAGHHAHPSAAASYVYGGKIGGSNSRHPPASIAGALAYATRHTQSLGPTGSECSSRTSQRSVGINSTALVAQRKTDYLQGAYELRPGALCSSCWPLSVE